MPTSSKFSTYFFKQPTIKVAKSLLGSLLWTRVNNKLVAGRIVEVEAYLGSDDPACHAAKGKTKRNAHMFECGGISYVYLIYGMYHCMNVVTEGEGIGSAVLIRAVEPTDGIDVMQARRKNIHLTNGPGRLCQAFGIEKNHSGLCLITSKEIGLQREKMIQEKNIGISSRIGISSGSDLPYRFYILGNKWVSK